MGISNAGAQLLLTARAAGADFSRTATLGRLTFRAEEAHLERLVRAFGLADPAAAILERCGSSGDRFLEYLGAQTVTSIDASDFEGASVVHDLNTPLPPELHEQYSLVFDGGTMEHVFWAPQAMRCAMESVELGGHMVTLTCGNNLLGHGFYQLSPDFFFQALSPANGYVCRAVMLCLPFLDPPLFFGVKAPGTVAPRTYLINPAPVYILAIGQRTEIKPIFAAPPQQSDYVARWDKDDEDPAPAPAAPTRERRGWKSYIPTPVRDVLRRLKPEPLDKGFRRIWFYPLSLEQMAAGQLGPP